MTALPLSSRNRVYGHYPAFQLGCPPSKTPSQERPPTAKRGDRWLHSALIEQRRVVEILAAGRAADPIVAQYILNRYAIKRQEAVTSLEKPPFHTFSLASPDLQ